MCDATDAEQLIPCLDTMNDERLACFFRELYLPDEKFFLNIGRRECQPIQSGFANENDPGMRYPFLQDFPLLVIGIPGVDTGRVEPVRMEFERRPQIEAEDSVLVLLLRNLMRMDIIILHHEKIRRVKGPDRIRPPPKGDNGRSASG